MPPAEEESPYVEMARDPNRILNHLDVITRSVEHLGTDSSSSPAAKAGHIELQLTDDCDLGCHHCHFRNQGDLHFDLSWLEQLCETMMPRAITLSGGGEPMNHPEFDEAVRELRLRLPDCALGLITNGLRFPEGSWREQLDWVRISLYSVVGGRYGGRNPTYRKQVLGRIDDYLGKTNIAHVGIGILVYRENASELPGLLHELSRRYSQAADRTRLNLQVRLAFNVVDAGNLTKHQHDQNIFFLPSRRGLSEVASQLGDLCRSDPSFAEFLGSNTNIDAEATLQGQLLGLTATTDPAETETKIETCYVALAYRLITPMGDVYPCLTLAESRDEAHRIGHIADHPLEHVAAVERFHGAPTSWCNTRQCRNTTHNEAVRSHLAGSGPSFGPERNLDPFF